MAGINQVYSSFSKYADDIARYVKSSGKTSILQTKPTYPKAPKDLRLSREAFEDTFLLREKPQNQTWEELVPHLEEKIKPANILGSGSEAFVYAIDDNYVLRMTGDKSMIHSPFLPVEDIFEGRNFGQAVARTKKGFSINRRVSGTHLYKSLDSDPKTYMQKLREYSELPEETLDAFVSDVAFINSKGWRIDQGNPENFLYDKRTGRINIIDLCKKRSSFLDYREPYGHDWILDPLIHGSVLTEVYEKLFPKERIEMFKLIEKLEQRILPLCKKHGIPISKWNKKNYHCDSIINLLELKKDIDVLSCDNILEYIIKQRYPELAKNAKILKKAKMCNKINKKNNVNNQFNLNLRNNQNEQVKKGHESLNSAKA